LLNEQSALRTDLNRTLGLEAETRDRITELRRQLEHDIYLGMASGARGVLIWSVFKRKEVLDLAAWHGG